MSEELKPGTVVVLKSGGPAMTIGWIDRDLTNPVAYCQWFKDEALIEGQFILTSLKFVVA